MTDAYVLLYRFKISGRIEGSVAEDMDMANYLAETEGNALAKGGKMTIVKIRGVEL